ncbi:unnamed protein product, partial [Discosporangium mesarthrocarpum]
VRGELGTLEDKALALAQVWRERSKSVQESFDSLEPVLALREAMLRILHRESPGPVTRHLVLRHLLDISESARRVGQHSIAQGALHRFLQVSRTEVGAAAGGMLATRAEERVFEGLRRQLAEARVFWGRGETDSAVRVARAAATRLKRLLEEGVGEGPPGGDERWREKQLLLSEALRLTGGWMAKTRSESSREILSSYLNPAVEAALAGAEPHGTTPTLAGVLGERRAAEEA